MNRIFNFSVIFALIFCFSLTASAQEERPAMPDLALKTIEGKVVRLKEYIKEGQVTYITFWATWASPCKKQLDGISDLLIEWKEKYNVNIIAISIDDQRTNPKVKSTVDAKGWEYQILCDPSQNSYQVLNFQTVPQSFLLDKKGKIAESKAGYNDGDIEILEQQLEKLSQEE